MVFEVTLSDVSPYTTTQPNSLRDTSNIFRRQQVSLDMSKSNTEKPGIHGELVFMRRQAYGTVHENVFSMDSRPGLP